MEVLQVEVTLFIGTPRIVGIRQKKTGAHNGPRERIACLRYENPVRGREVADYFLVDFSGTLQTDAYAG